MSRSTETVVPRRLARTQPTSAPPSVSLMNRQRVMSARSSSNVSTKGGIDRSS
jgi:hypothetical protein